MEGFGIYTWSDGRSYEGDYYDDKKHGYDWYRWADGRLYEGFWHRGKQYGLGVYRNGGDSEEKEKNGLWEDGRRIKWFETELEIEAVNDGTLDYT